MCLAGISLFLAFRVTHSHLYQVAVTFRTTECTLKRLLFSLRYFLIRKILQNLAEAAELVANKFFPVPRLVSKNDPLHHFREKVA